MADEFSELAFAEDLKEALLTDDAKRWVVENPADLELYVMVSPRSKPEEKFQARFLWNAYPSEPPSYKYRDPATGRLDLVTAWPIVQGYRPSSFDACVSWTSEGFIAHPEWKNDANIRWNPKGNAIIRVLRYMQRDLDERYQGRFS